MEPTEARIPELFKAFPDCRSDGLEQATYGYEGDQGLWNASLTRMQNITSDDGSEEPPIDGSRCRRAMDRDGGGDRYERSRASGTTVRNMPEGPEAGQGGVPQMFVMVGLPAAGQTSRARELASKWSALRLTPDEWMIPLFGQEQPEGKRNILEGRLIWLALSALRLGVNVVLDFGVWAKEERSALRALAASVGATSELVYLPVDRDEQWRRVQAHSVTGSASRFEMTMSDLDRWRRDFQTPDAAELETADIDPPPAGFDTWEAWAAEWWPTSLPVTRAAPASPSGRE